MARIDWKEEVRLGKPKEWQLCFQWCEYIYEDEDDTSEFGYRFIWRRPDGSLPHRSRTIVTPCSRTIVSCGNYCSPRDVIAR